MVLGSLQSNVLVVMYRFTQTYAYFEVYSSAYSPYVFLGWLVKLLVTDALHCNKDPKGMMEYPVWARTVHV